MSLTFLLKRKMLDFSLLQNRLLGLLRMAVESELRKRKKLDNVNTIDDVVNLIQSSNNIIALVGAGLSITIISLTDRNQYKLWNP